MCARACLCLYVRLHVCGLIACHRCVYVTEPVWPASGQIQNTYSTAETKNVWLISITFSVLNFRHFQYFILYAPPFNTTAHCLRLHMHLLFIICLELCILSILYYCVGRKKCYDLSRLFKTQRLRTALSLFLDN